MSHQARYEKFSMRYPQKEGESSAHYRRRVFRMAFIQATTDVENPKVKEALFALLDYITELDPDRAL